jgi:hypothetical protein
MPTGIPILLFSGRFTGRKKVGNFHKIKHVVYLQKRIGRFAMTAREQIKNQIDTLPEQLIEKVWEFISLLKAEPFLQPMPISMFYGVPETDDPEDIAAYDAAKAVDDGYRISSEDLWKKYDLQS